MQSVKTMIGALFLAWAGSANAIGPCVLEENASGNLICRQDGRTRVIAEDFRVNEPIEISGIFNRSTRKYLKLENFATDKTMIIVPIITIEDSPYYERILTFSLDRRAQAADRNRAYYGQEYALEKPKPVDGFNWDKLSDELKRGYERSRQNPKSGVVPGIEAPKGYVLTPVALFEADGSYRGIRYYKDQVSNGFSPEETECLANCWNRNGQHEDL